MPNLGRDRTMATYFFAKDTKPGDTIGQGVQSIWYVLSASGAQIGG